MLVKGVPDLRIPDLQMSCSDLMCIKENIMPKAMTAKRITPSHESSAWRWHVVGIGDSQYSDEWKRQRSTTLQILRRLGYGKRSIQLKIQEEMQYVSDEIMARVGKPFDPDLTIQLAASNIVCAMIYGERYDTSDVEFLNLQNILQGSIRLFFEEAIGDFLWFYKFKPSYRKVFRDLKAINKKVNDFNERKVNERRQRVEQDGFSDEPGDFIEAYLKELQCGTAVQGKIQQNWLPSLLNDFLFVGSETTSVSIAWALLWVADRQDVQAKVGQDPFSVSYSE